MSCVKIQYHSFHNEGWISLQGHLVYIFLVQVQVFLLIPDSVYHNNKSALQTNSVKSWVQQVKSLEFVSSQSNVKIQHPNKLTEYMSTEKATICYTTEASLVKYSSNIAYIHTTEK